MQDLYHQRSCWDLTRDHLENYPSVDSVAAGESLPLATCTALHDPAKSNHCGAAALASARCCYAATYTLGMIGAATHIVILLLVLLSLRQCLLK